MCACTRNESETILKLNSNQNGLNVWIGCNIWRGNSIMIGINGLINAVSLI